MSTQLSRNKRECRGLRRAKSECCFPQRYYFPRISFCRAKMLLRKGNKFRVVDKFHERPATLHKKKFEHLGCIRVIHIQSIFSAFATTCEHGCENFVKFGRILRHAVFNLVHRFPILNMINTFWLHSVKYVIKQNCSVPKAPSSNERVVVVCMIHRDPGNGSHTVFMVNVCQPREGVASQVLCEGREHTHLHSYNAWTVQPLLLNMLLNIFCY
jgi:hypothetical protein